MNLNHREVSEMVYALKGLSVSEFHISQALGHAKTIGFEMELNKMLDNLSLPLVRMDYTVTFP